MEQPGQADMGQRLKLGARGAQPPAPHPSTLILFSPAFCGDLGEAPQPL